MKKQIKSYLEARNQRKDAEKAAVALVLLTVAGFSMADTFDTSTVTAAIQAAGVAIVAVIMALIGLSTTIFGGAIVYKFVSRKAGA